MFIDERTISWDPLYQEGRKGRRGDRFGVCNHSTHDACRNRIFLYQGVREHVFVPSRNGVAQALLTFSSNLPV